MQSNKRGQITIFIILGIVLVIIIALALYLINSSKTEEFTKPNIKVETQFEPVQDYVQQCMNSLLTESVIRIGQHGGYIDPTDPVLSGFDIVANTAEQYNSDLAFLSSTDKTSGVAYWFHAKSINGCDNCMVNTLAPSISDMEQQITHYITRNIQSCLDSFSVFDGKGYDIMDTHNYTVRTSISEMGVAVIMDGEILLKIADQDGKLTKFYTETDIPLKKYYDMATIITVKEAENNFLENVGLYLIYAHSGLSTNRLPPMRDQTEGYSVLWWSKTQTKQQFESLLLSYIPVLRVPRTKNFFDVDYSTLAPSEKYFYNATKLDFFSNLTLSDTEISFAYLGQDTYFDITPSDGELLKPTTNVPPKFSYFFEGRRLNYYNFRYATAYPVVVIITDEYKPKATFTFMFALEGNIKNNLKIADYLNESNAPIIWEPSFVTVNYNIPESDAVDLSGYNVDEGFAQEVSQEAQSSPNIDNFGLPTSVDTRFCNPAQRVSGTVRLQTYDSVTGQSLGDVSMKFGCGNFVECDIGRTIYNSTLQESLWQGNLPTCKNGYIVLSKEGYLPKNVLLSTDSSSAQDLGSIYLDPIVTKNFVLKKYQVTKNMTINSNGEVVYRHYALDSASSEILSTESVVISLEKIPADNLDEPFGQSAVLSQNFNTTNTEIMLTPGKYAVNIQVLDHAGIIIPKDCKTICVEYSDNGKRCKDTDTIPDDNIVINPAPLGGIQFNNRTFFYVSAANLMGDNVLEFNIIKMPYPACFDDMDDMSNIGTVSEQYRTRLVPRFVAKE